jgi:hypothetical protein
MLLWPNPLPLVQASCSTAIGGPSIPVSLWDCTSGGRGCDSPSTFPQAWHALGGQEMVNE